MREHLVDHKIGQSDVKAAVEVRMWIHHCLRCGKHFDSAKKLDYCPRCGQHHIAVGSFIADAVSMN